MRIHWSSKGQVLSKWCPRVCESNGLQCHWMQTISKANELESNKRKFAPLRQIRCPLWKFLAIEDTQPYRLRARFRADGDASRDSPHAHASAGRNVRKPSSSTAVHCANVRSFSANTPRRQCTRHYNAPLTLLCHARTLGCARSLFQSIPRIARPSSERARDSATYIWPHSKTLRKPISTRSRLMPWLL